MPSLKHFCLPEGAKRRLSAAAREDADRLTLTPNVHENPFRPAGPSSLRSRRRGRTHFRGQGTRQSRRVRNTYRFGTDAERRALSVSARRKHVPQKVRTVPQNTSAEDRICV